MEPWLQTIVGDVDPEAVTALDLDGNGPAWAGRDPLEAVAFLRAFPNLEELVLASQALDSPPPAAAWPHLSVLDCADNLIDDLAPLATPSALTSLNLAFNELRDLTPLAQQPQLRELNLGHNQIKDVAPLASLTALETLVLSGNRPLHAIAPLAGLKALQYLYLRQCRLASLEALAAHPALVHLSCVLTEPRLLAPLQSCPHLTSLDLTDYWGSSLEGLPPLPQVRKLRLTRSPHLADVAALASWQGLEELDLSYNNLRDVAFARALPRLQRLNLRGNPVPDQAELRALADKISITLG